MRPLMACPTSAASPGRFPERAASSRAGSASGRPPRRPCALAPRARSCPEGSTPRVDLEAIRLRLGAADRAPILPRRSALPRGPQRARRPTCVFPWPRPRDPNIGRANVCPVIGLFADILALLSGCRRPARLLGSPTCDGPDRHRRVCPGTTGATFIGSRAGWTPIGVLAAACAAGLLLAVGPASGQTIESKRAQAEAIVAEVESMNHELETTIEAWNYANVELDVRDPTIARDRVDADAADDVPVRVATAISRARSPRRARPPSSVSRRHARARSQPSRRRR